MMYNVTKCKKKRNIKIYLNVLHNNVRTLYNIIIRFQKRFMQFLFILSLQFFWWFLLVGMGMKKMENSQPRIYHSAKSLKPLKLNFLLLPRIEFTSIQFLILNTYVLKKLNSIHFYSYSSRHKNKVHTCSTFGLVIFVKKRPIIWFFLFHCKTNEIQTIFKMH